MGGADTGSSTASLTRFELGEVAEVAEVEVELVGLGESARLPLLSAGDMMKNLLCR